MKDRFSKANLRADLELAIMRIQQEWDFDLSNGTAQLNAKSTYDLIKKSVAYGELRAIEAIIENYLD
jgi:hypothetical protein